MITDAQGRLTGRTVLFACLGAFAVIIAANGALLVAALGSFPGTVVANSYVASQDFDDRRAETEARGWALAPGFSGEALTLAVTDARGAPVRGLAVAVTVGRPAVAATDRTLALEPAGAGYAAPLSLPPGRWQASFRVQGADGPPLDYRSTFTVER